MHALESVHRTVLHKIWKIWAQMSISSSEIRSWRNKALPRFIYLVLDRGYRLWNMIMVNTLSSGDREETWWVWSRNDKTHTFFLKIEVEMMSNNGDFGEEHGGFERGSIGEDNEQSQKFEGKPKRFKKLTYLCKARDFRNWVKSRTSRHGKSQDSLKLEFLKIFLCVFCDWKFYPRKSHKVSHENFCVTLATRPSTHEQVARLSREKH